MSRGKVTVLIIALVLITQCSQRGTDPNGDHTPPSSIQNLTVSALSPTEAQLTWTATGDDDNSGAATSYDVVYCPDLMSLMSDTGVVAWPDPPQPGVSGSVEKCVVSGLSPDTTYWFAVYAYDENRNRSAISNQASRKKIDPVGLAITQPADGAHLADQVHIIVSDSGNIPLEGVWLYIDSTRTDSSFSRPWEFNWMVGTLQHGSTHTLWAETGTTNGDRYYSNMIRVTIDTMQAYPHIPERFDIVQYSDHHAVVRWNRNRDDDFLYYRIDCLRENEEKVDSVYFYSRFDTTYTVTDLVGLTDYTIVLSIGDKTNHRSSTELSLTTLDSIPPRLEMVEPCRETSFAARIGWVNPHLYDFSAYEMYRSLDTVLV